RGYRKAAIFHERAELSIELFNALQLALGILVGHPLRFGTESPFHERANDAHVSLPGDARKSLGEPLRVGELPVREPSLSEREAESVLVLRRPHCVELPAQIACQELFLFFLCFVRAEPTGVLLANALIVPLLGVDRFGSQPLLQFASIAILSSTQEVV